MTLLKLQKQKPVQDPSKYDRGYRYSGGPGNSTGGAAAAQASAEAARRAADGAATR